MATSNRGSLVIANNSPRTNSAPKPNSKSGRRPKRCAVRPTHGESTVTVNCGMTIAAATMIVAASLDRSVSMLAASGSIAALAR